MKTYLFAEKDSMVELYLRDQGYDNPKLVLEVGGWETLAQVLDPYQHDPLTQLEEFKTDVAKLIADLQIVQTKLAEIRDIT